MRKDAEWGKKKSGRLVRGRGGVENRQGRQPVSKRETSREGLGAVGGDKV